MPTRTREELLGELNAAVRSGGVGGKTTATDLRRFLTLLIDQLPGPQQSFEEVLLFSGYGDLGPEFFTRDVVIQSLQRSEGLAGLRYKLGRTGTYQEVEFAGSSPTASLQIVVAAGVEIYWQPTYRAEVTAASAILQLA